MKKYIFILISLFASTSVFAETINTTEVLCNKKIRGSSPDGSTDSIVMVIVQREFPSNKMNLKVAINGTVDSSLSGEVKRSNSESVFSVTGASDLNVGFAGPWGDQIEGSLKLSNGHSIHGMNCSIYAKK